jgi:hypothetical protein
MMGFCPTPKGSSPIHGTLLMVNSVTLMGTGGRSWLKEILMKICVLNGSPRGRDNISLQYIRFSGPAFLSRIRDRNAGQRSAGSLTRENVITLSYC